MSQPQSPGPVTRIECVATPAFAAWISQLPGSVAITTYQAGKVVVLGWDGRQISMLPRDFDKPLGLARDGNRLALATRHEIVLLANAPMLAHDYIETQRGRYDALYLPRASYYTGDINAHDLAYSKTGLVVCNTRFSCLAKLSDEHSFTPIWKPPFITEVVPEDRCHLNGVAIVEGRPKYVTALGESDVVGGWRANKASGGIMIDVETGAIVLRGLSMPHSPRWYDGSLWVLNSGQGELLRIDTTNGQSTVVCELPGYLRGLSFVGPYALVGLCQIREKHIFGGLPIQRKHSQLRCGMGVVDLRTGAQTAFFEFTQGIQELFEVLFLPGARQPMVTNTLIPATRDAFTAPEFSYWLRPSTMIEDST